MSNPKLSGHTGVGQTIGSMMEDKDKHRTVESQADSRESQKGAVQENP